MTNDKMKLEKKAGRLIKREYIIWLTTVDANLVPQPRPVWFVWDRDSFLVFSQPQAHKVAHLKRHPAVSLHFNTDESGDKDVVVYIGNAVLDPAIPAAHKVPAYLKKYRKGIRNLGMTPEQFSREYSVAIRIKPAGLRGW